MQIKTGKCPGCQQVMTSTILQNIPAKTALFGGNEYPAAAYQCPSCNTIISISLDPIAVRNDLIAELMKELKKSR